MSKRKELTKFVSEFIKKNQTKEYEIDAGVIGGVQVNYFFVDSDGESVAWSFGDNVGCEYILYCSSHPNKDKSRCDDGNVCGSISRHMFLKHHYNLLETANFKLEEEILVNT
jgi:hypothetical protein